MGQRYLFIYFFTTDGNIASNKFLKKKPYEVYETIWKKQKILMWLDLEQFQGW